MGERKRYGNEKGTADLKGTKKVPRGTKKVPRTLKRRADLKTSREGCVGIRFKGSWSGCGRGPIEPKFEVEIFGQACFVFGTICGEVSYL